MGFQRNLPTPIIEATRKAFIDAADIVVDNSVNSVNGTKIRLSLSNGKVLDFKNLGGMDWCILNSLGSDSFSGLVGREIEYVFERDRLEFFGYGSLYLKANMVISISFEDKASFEEFMEEN